MDKEDTKKRDLCKTPPFSQSRRQTQISILKILNVFLWLKFSFSLILTKIEHFSKVSKRYSKICLIVFPILLICLEALSCLALQPEEICVIANKNVSKSVVLAKYYIKRRKIPEENLINLRVTDKETCSRLEYEQKIADPVRKFIKKINLKQRIKCLVVVYGIPLRVLGPKVFKNKKDQNRSKIKDASSSLDSEIALVLVKDYPLAGWIKNPYYLGNKNSIFSIKKKNVLMVSRLDGPTDKIVKRIIDDCLKTERDGLEGTAYFDARWAFQNDKNTDGYAVYDRSIHFAARTVKKSGLVKVVLDENEKLFKPGECKKAALYCGWYSLGRYIDSFQWQPGSIGYHIASNECSTLKNKNSRTWCINMLEKGIGATIGPVNEPYVQAFPVPEIFFGFLVDGYLTLAECYLISTPYLSWQMVLIGDPLYRPFAKRLK